MVVTAAVVLSMSLTRVVTACRYSAGDVLCITRPGAVTVAVILGMAGSRRLTPFVSLSAALFAKTSAVYNPFIYVFAHSKFRRVRSRAAGWGADRRTRLRNEIFKSACHVV